MKELSIEEKAKRYDEVINRMKHYVVDEYGCSRIKVVDVFPELKEESEDEKIRKWIIDKLNDSLHSIESLYDRDYDSLRKAIAWLEKQGEQKFADEPKFNVGDWVVSPNGVYWHIDAIQNGRYEVTADTGQCGNWPLDTNIYRLWTIQDAKDGDVLAEDTCTFIIKKLNDDLSAKIYCCLFDDGDFELNFNLGFDDTCTYPATKEQRDLLFQKIKEVGYEWDAEKKELEKQGEQRAAWSEEDLPEFESYLCLMFQKFRTKGICTNGEIIDYVKEHSQKLKDTLCHAWSEEDEMMALGIEQLCNCASLLNISPDKVNKVKQWLKSLKDRVQPKQKRSEEDERIYKSIIYSFAHNYPLTVQQQEFVKSLQDKVQPQNTWKPSEEQMITLRHVISGCSYDIEPLVEIETKLKEL